VRFAGFDFRQKNVVAGLGLMGASWEPDRIERRDMKRHARGGILSALVVTGFVVMIAAGSAHPSADGRGALSAVEEQQGAPQAGGGGGGRGFASNFTGTITVGETAAMRMSRIRFEAGARTHWHLHSTGQLLLVEEGAGRLQELGDRMVELRVGQPVYTKPNVKHWHGASPNEAVVQFSVYSGTLEWLEPVSDADYLGTGR
jgi:quercetin dioxygenase-like cupin family protein